MDRRGGRDPCDASHLGIDEVEIHRSSLCQAKIGTIIGRSVIVRMPGAAAQTTGTALTARFAVYPGERSAISSIGNGNGISTSSGASPSTEIRQPVGERLHAGSSSWLQYHVAWKRSSSRPSFRPDTVI